MVALVIAFALLAPPTCRTADARVEDAIESVVRASGGDEYCQYRLYDALDDVDGDGLEDLVVVFTVEAAGGNDSVQHMTVLQSSKGWRPATTVVGRKGQRIVESIEVEEGPIIVLGTAEYAKGDADCCPSTESETRYRMVKGRLTPVTDETPPAGKSTSRRVPGLDRPV